MMLRIPTRSRRLRWLTLGYGILVFLWLSPEDNHVAPIAVLGGGLSALLVILMVTGRLGGKEIPARYIPLVGLALGAITGLGAALTTAGLMLFKNALHAHIFLDYPPGLMLDILARAPVWTLAGGLAGLGLGLAWVGLSTA